MVQRSEWEHILDELRVSRGHEDKKNLLRFAIKNIIESLEAKQRSLEEKLADERERKEWLEKKLADEKERLEKKLADEKERLEKKLVDEKERLEKKLADEKERLEKKLADEKERFREKMKTEEALKRTSEITLQERQARWDLEKESFAKKLEQLEGELQKKESELSSLFEELEQEKENCQALKARHKELATLSAKSEEIACSLLSNGPILSKVTTCKARPLANNSRSATRNMQLRDHSSFLLGLLGFFQYLRKNNSPESVLQEVMGPCLARLVSVADTSKLLGDKNFEVVDTHLSNTVYSSRKPDLTVVVHLPGELSPSTNKAGVCGPAAFAVELKSSTDDAVLWDSKGEGKHAVQCASFAYEVLQQGDLPEATCFYLSPVRWSCVTVEKKEFRLFFSESFDFISFAELPDRVLKACAALVTEISGAAKNGGIAAKVHSKEVQVESKAEGSASTSQTRRATTGAPKRQSKMAQSNPATAGSGAVANEASYESNSGGALQLAALEDSLPSSEEEGGAIVRKIEQIGSLLVTVEDNREEAVESFCGPLLVLLDQLCAVLSSFQYSSDKSSYVDFPTRYLTGISFSRRVLRTPGGLLGCGASACVWKGYDMQKNKPCALKVFYDLKGKQLPDEHRILKMLQSLYEDTNYTPPFVQIYDGFGIATVEDWRVERKSTSTHPCIALWPVGEPLRTDGVYPASAWAELLFGLAWLHRKGYVHRDLRLPNLIWVEREKGGKIYLIDFHFCVEWRQKFVYEGADGNCPTYIRGLSEEEKYQTTHYHTPFDDLEELLLMVPKEAGEPGKVDQLLAECQSGRSSLLDRPSGAPEMTQEDWARYDGVRYEMPSLLARMLNVHSTAIIRRPRKFYNSSKSYNRSLE